MLGPILGSPYLGKLPYSPCYNIFNTEPVTLKNHTSNKGAREPCLGWIAGIQRDRCHNQRQANSSSPPGPAGGHKTSNEQCFLVEPSKIIFLIENTIPPKEDILLPYSGYHSLPK